MYSAFKVPLFHGQETLQKLQALGGEEEKAKRLKAATAAADAQPRSAVEIR